MGGLYGFPSRRSFQKATWNQFVRQQVSESRENCPLCGCAGQSMTESDVENEVLPHVVIQRPQVPDNIAAEKRLREVPYFSGNTDLLHQGMGDRERLPELSAVNRIVDVVVEEEIRIIVKAF